MKTRLVYPLIFGAMALCFSSCATQDMIAKAQGVPGPMDPPNMPPMAPNPLYYALVPVVLPFDLVAWPFELIYMQNREAGGPPPPNYPPPQYQGQPQQYPQPYRPTPPPGVTWSE